MYKINNYIINIWKTFFWPLNNFKDCHRGSQLERLHAYNFNRKNVDLLILPIINLMLLTCIWFSLISCFEGFANKVDMVFIYLAVTSAIFGVFSLVGFLILGISFMFLSKRKHYGF